MAKARLKFKDDKGHTKKDSTAAAPPKDQAPVKAIKIQAFKEPASKSLLAFATVFYRTIGVSWAVVTFILAILFGLYFIRH